MRLRFQLTRSACGPYGSANSFIVGFMALLVIFGGAISSQAAVSPEDVKKRQEVEKLIKSAEDNLRAEKYNEAAEQIKQAQPALAQLSEVKEFARLVENLSSRVRQVHAMLELEGLKLDPLQLPALVKSEPNRPGAARPRAAPDRGAQTGGVSFTREIAPLLVAKCGRCHVSDNKGMFSMANYAVLKKGPAEGVVIMPGKSDGSRLIEVIESGDMPRGNIKVSQPELATLKKWIDEGAKFDGRDEQANLLALARATPNQPAPMPAAPPMATIASPTGKETVRFALDIAPVLSANCLDCHGGGNQASGGLRMGNFRDLVQGGQSGAPWVAGNANESLLVKKLKGTAGARMPLNRPALADDVIAKFEKWIQEGATFDGESPTQGLPLLAALARTKSLTHNELAADRMKAARDKFRLALPTKTPGVRETKNFFIIGNVSDSVLDEAAAAAEKQAATLGRFFRTPPDKPLMKGRMTLFLLPNGYEYREFGQMVEDRQLPTEWRGHSRFDVLEAYGVIVPPRDGDGYSLEGLIAEQITGMYVASIGNPPSWFIEGSARAQAARVDPRGSRTRGWNNRVRELLAAGEIQRFLTRGLAPEDNDIAAYGFVSSLMRSNKYPALIVAMRGGGEFEPSFTRQFGPPPAAVMNWARASGR